MTQYTSRQTNTIGLLASTLPAAEIALIPYTAAILNGVVSAAAANDYNLTLLTRRWDNHEQPEPWLKGCAIDGLLMIAPSIHSEVVHFVTEIGVPLIGISAEAADTGIPTVEVDNDGGAIMATEHLISLGHRRIAHLSGSDGQSSAYARRDGYYRTMMARGLDIPDEYLVETAYFGEKPYVEALKLLESRNRPTAIFAASDYVAVEVMRAARDLGVSVPRELSVVGFDDAPYAEHSDPPLTTIRQPLVEMGRHAVNMLISRLNGQTVDARTHVLSGQLVVRGSSGPA